MSMPEKCDQCGLRYEQEPSFFSGAMYVSYALQVALFTTVYVALRVLFNPEMETYMYAIIGAAIIFFPITLRLSRSIYINFFVSYKAGVTNQKA
jgi:phosphate starvation-inducible membrane PsiE